jgi:hypothetical protein
VTPVQRQQRERPVLILYEDLWPIGLTIAEIPRKISRESTKQKPFGSLHWAFNLHAPVNILGYLTALFNGKIKEYNYFFKYELNE